MKSKIATLLRAWAQTLQPIEPTPPPSAENSRKMFFDAVTQYLSELRVDYEVLIDSLPIEVWTMTAPQTKEYLRRETARELAKHLEGIVEVTHVHGRRYRVGARVYIASHDLKIKPDN